MYFKRLQRFKLKKNKRGGGWHGTCILLWGKFPRYSHNPEYILFKQEIYSHEKGKGMLYRYSVFWIYKVISTVTFFLLKK